MKLFHSGTSPYVRKVMMVLHITGQAKTTELISGGGTPLNPNDDTVGANPLGKVPTLITDDGQAIFDSRVITRYLDQKFEAGLYPGGDTLYSILTMEALADGIVDAAILMVYESRLRPEGMRYDPWLDGQRSKVVRGVATLERMTGHLEGTVTAAHIATAAALGYLDLRFAKLRWRDTAPKLASWYGDFAAKPFMKATAPAE